MDNAPEFVGRLVVLAILACPAVYFLDQALRVQPTSRRLANIALSCGLTVFVMPEILMGWSAASQPLVFLASAALRVLLGITGMGLGLISLFGPRDGGSGIMRPLFGVGVSLLHAMMGGGFALFVAFAHPSSPWDYLSPDGALRLTLPSWQWRQAQNTGNDQTAFVCSVPRMQAKVTAVRREQTVADFAQAVSAFRARVEATKSLSQPASVREGTNTAGNSYVYFTGMDVSPDGKPVFVAYSVTWCARKKMVIEVLFEGLVRNRSEFGKATEIGSFEKSAEIICLSVD